MIICDYCEKVIERRVFCSGKCRMAMGRKEGRIKPKQPIPKTIRIEIFAKDGGKCKKCGTTEKLSVDHIIPESKGGTLDILNLQTLCMPCNRKKGNRYIG